MQPIEINVRVTVGMEAALLGIVSKLAGGGGVTPDKAQEPKPGKQETRRQEEKPLPTEAVKPDAPLPTQPMAEAATPDTPMAEAATPVQDGGVRECTTVDVRAAMDRTRRRIEGEDYKENSESEGYKRWHRVLTGWFKSQAAACGAEKPSALPDSGSRQRFIELCDGLRVENGELAEEPCPF